MSKKNKLKTFIKLYYFILAFALVSQLLMTAFKLSQTISYQQRISALESQRRQLSREQEEIQIQLGKMSSLSLNQEQLTEKYQPISSVFVIPTDAPLALRLE